jgi:hypothetical protein
MQGVSIDIKVINSYALNLLFGWINFN